MLNIHSIICSYYRLNIEHIQSTSSVIVSWNGKVAMGRNIVTADHCKAL